MKPTMTWILIADGARARVLSHDGPGHGVREVDGMEFTGDHAATHDIVSDQQGRSFSSHGHGRSAIDSRSDPHRELKDKFAHSLAAMLAAKLSDKAYDRLVIVASPVTLGDLRAALSEHVKAVVIGEIAQDLTKLPNNKVANHLKDVLAV